MKARNMLSMAVIVLILVPVIYNNAVDTTPPTIKNVVANPNPAIQGETVTIECVVTDNVAVARVKVVIKYPDGSLANMTMVKSTDGEYRYRQVFDVAGIYIYHIWANDTSGNSNISSNHTFVVKEDTYPPQTYCSLSGTEGNNGWYISNVEAALYSRDRGTGVKDIFYMLDGSPWLQYHNSFDVISEGIHDLYYYAEDNAGNIENVNHTQIKIDKTNPKTQCNLYGTMGKNGWYISNVTVSLIASDAMSGVNKTFYKLDDGAWKEYNASFIVSEDTTHTLSYYSIDKAGNVEKNNTVTFKIDKISPIAIIQKPKQGYLYIEDREILPTVLGNTLIIGRITIYVDASNHESGINRVEFYIDNVLQEAVSQPPYTWQWNYLAIGTHLVKAVAYDNAGNYGSDEITVFIMNI